MNVYKHELRALGMSALGWTAALSMLGLAVVSIFPYFARDIEPFVQMLKSYPPQVLSALGIDRASINSFNGFYSFMYVFIVLCAAIMGLVFGLTAIGKEGARKTSDFLFTRPMSRVGILLSKYCAVLTLCALVCLVYALITYLAGLSQVADFDRHTYLLFSGALGLTTLFCATIGFCVGCFARKVKAPNALGIAIGSLMFALLMVDNLSEKNSIALISPLSYLSARHIATHRAYDMGYFWALIALCVALAAAGIVRYKTRDIHAA